MFVGDVASVLPAARGGDRVLSCALPVYSQEAWCTFGHATVPTCLAQLFFRLERDEVSRRYLVACGCVTSGMRSFGVSDSVEMAHCFNGLESPL